MAGGCYHLKASTGSRKTGQSAAAKHDYLNREGRYEKDAAELVYAESGNMPEWASGEQDREYWRAADAYERANGRLFKHLEVALPIGLNRDDRIRLAHEFARELTSNVDGGNLPYTLTVHKGKGTNPHFDLMISERVNDGIARSAETWFKRAAALSQGQSPEKYGARKTDALKPEEWLEQTRARWAELANRALARAGRRERLDHRSYERQGIDKLPTIHEGLAARQMQARGEIKSDRVALNAEIRAANIELAKIEVQSYEARAQLTQLERDINSRAGHGIEGAGRVSVSTPSSRPIADGNADRPQELTAEGNNRRLLDIAKAIEERGEARVSNVGVRVFADSLFTPDSAKHLHGDGYLRGSRFIRDISVPGNRIACGAGGICEIQVSGTPGRFEYKIVAKAGRHELAALIRDNAQDQLKWDRMVEASRERARSMPKEQTQERPRGKTHDGPTR